MRQSEVLQQVSHYQSASLTDVVNANRVLATLQASADQAVAAQQSAFAHVAATKAAVEKVLSQQTALLTAAQAKAAQDAAVAASAAETAALERQRHLVVSRSIVRPALSVTTRTTHAQGPAPVVASIDGGRSGIVGQGRQDVGLRVRPAQQAVSLRRRRRARVRLFRSGRCARRLRRAFRSRTRPRHNSGRVTECRCRNCSPAIWCFG